MIDIHAHILPDTDDGAYNMAESLRMLQMAEVSGVDTIIATPHCNIPGSFTNYISEAVEERFRMLQKASKEAGQNIQIIKGMEVFATVWMSKLLQEGKVWTLNGTKYFLTEFNFRENPEFAMIVLEDCFDAGFVPVIAHPERYYFVQNNPEIVYEWYCQGYGIQINKGSILGRFGQRAQEAAELLLGHGLVSCVASDAHSSQKRTTHMAEVKTFLEKNYGKDYAKLVLETNPARILCGEDLVRMKPIPIR